MSNTLSRRQFLEVSGVSAAGVAALGGAGAATAGADETTDLSVPEIVQNQGRIELAVPEEPAPEVTSYECDVLVVGCGSAGLHAAAYAADAGKSVIVVEKGHPGYGGLSSWGVNAAYFDGEKGDDAEKIKTMQMQSNEYTANLNWVQIWCDESKEYWETITKWGLANEYPHATETGHWVDGIFTDSDQPGHDDKRSYFQSMMDVERHHFVDKVIEDKGITSVDHTMILDVLEQDGRVVGALGLHVPSGTIIEFKAKAVVLATGTGCIKPAGFPTGGDTFDGVWIGYQHGLPIVNLEFEDYHLAYGPEAGLPLTTAGWAYCEQLALGGPGIHTDTPDESLWGSGYERKTVYAAVVDGLATADPTSQRVNSGKLASDYPDDPRIGSFTSPEIHWSAPGAAPAMPVHMASGIFTSFDDTDGATALPGLYCAGDGTYASLMGGTLYTGLGAITVAGCALQGKHAGMAAAAYVDSVELVDLPAETVQTLTDEVFAPLSQEKGYNPTWINEQILHVMAQQATLFTKSEESLNAALTQIRYIRDVYLPKMKAENSHDLRVCQELRHKVSACEIKLLQGIARKESRGMHYRTDYPFRDDQYLGFFSVTKTDDDSMQVGFIEMKEEWKGDTSLPYEERYPLYYFPGETEAKGIVIEEVAASGH